MNKFKLTMYEMIEVLDPINKNAYDKLQIALEQKICEAMGEEKWREIWVTSDWDIEMSISFNEKTEAV